MTKKSEYHVVEQPHGYEVCQGSRVIAITGYHNWFPRDAKAMATKLTRLLNKSQEKGVYLSPAKADRLASLLYALICYEERVVESDNKDTDPDDIRAAVRNIKSAKSLREKLLDT